GNGPVQSCCTWIRCQRKQRDHRASSEKLRRGARQRTCGQPVPGPGRSVVCRCKWSVTRGLGAKLQKLRSALRLCLSGAQQSCSGWRFWHIPDGSRAGGRKQPANPDRLYAEHESGSVVEQRSVVRGHVGESVS